MSSIRWFTAVLCSGIASAQGWKVVPSGATISMRGVSAVNSKVVWASGTSGTYLRTTDGGATWRVVKVPGAEDLDFRDVEGVDGRTAYLLSSGPGDKSRIYKTTDGGTHWTLLFSNPDARGFLDAIAFWDAKRGIALGDPVDGQLVILTTGDGGAHWSRQHAPAALAKEGAFAASGTCLIVRGRGEAWFGTGGPGAARVFHSTDSGRTWNVTLTPIRNDSSSAGIFSLAFSDAAHGVAVGGDYSKPNDASRNIAVTADGGLTWSEPDGAHPGGYRSAVAFLPKLRLWIATGPSGSDVSSDGGRSWRPFDGGAFNAMSFGAGAAGWAVGPNGRLAVFQLH